MHVMAKLFDWVIFPYIFIDEFHDKLARLSPFERQQILAVMKAAQEEHFEATHAVSSHPLSQSGNVFS